MCTDASVTTQTKGGMVIMTSIATTLVQLGNHSDSKTGAVSAPVYFSTAYEHTGLRQSTGYDYTRTKNPTRSVLEQGIAKLELGDEGFACSSGMAAIQLVMGLLKAGDRVVVPDDIYGGTYRLFTYLTTHYAIEVSYVNFADTNAVAQALATPAAMIFLETPTNPLMQRYDIAQFSKQDAIVVVDNTFLTPYFQQPLTLGADIVVHSATKYLGGHNDVLAGLVVAKGKKLCERLAFLHNTSGFTLSPMDSWLIVRGLKTLHLRMHQHDANAKAVVAFLQSHAQVTDVLYAGKGGMVSFRLQREQDIDLFLRSLQLVTFAESLGGVESFITYPATQTHADIPYEERIARGVCNRLLRFSVGVEEVADIIADLKQAFAAL